MPDLPNPDALDHMLEHETRIDLAARLDAALDEATAHAAHVHDLLQPLLALADELHTTLHRPLLSDHQRQHILGRAQALAGHNTRGFRRAWPQLATHPAVVGGAAAAVLAAVGIAAAALRDRRTQPDAHPILGAA